MNWNDGQALMTLRNRYDDQASMVDPDELV